MLRQQGICATGPDIRVLAMTLSVALNQPRPEAPPAFMHYAGLLVESAFQPIVSLTHQRIVGYEALVRPSQHNVAVSPGLLFNAAERQQQAHWLDGQLRRLHVENFCQHRRPTWLFLNVSTASIGAQRLDVDTLARQVRQQGLSTSQVVLEVVEEPARNERRLAEFVNAVREQGFRIAIDDFGAGDSKIGRAHV